LVIGGRDQRLPCELYKCRRLLQIIELAAARGRTVEQQRLERRLAALRREGQRLIDAYQSGVIELSDLKERRERVSEECKRLEEKLIALKQQQQEQQRQAALATTIEEFCRNINSALDNPSFETKQKILRLVVDRVEFVEGQITIKHVIPVSDVRLRRNQHKRHIPRFRKGAR
jgi:chromosome segregation ATPase